MKVITLANIKGGIGKTSNLIFLSLVARNKGFKCLVIDTDVNNNLTDYFLRDEPVEKIEENNLSHLFLGDKFMNEVIHKTSFDIDIIPVTPAIENASYYVASDPSFMIRIINELKDQEYDYVFIDTTPGQGVAFRTAVALSDVIISPIGLGRWTLLASQTMNSIVDGISKSMKKEIKKVNTPTTVTKVENEKIRTIGLEMTETTIKKAKPVHMAITKGTELKEGSASYEMYENLFNEVCI